MGAHLDFGLLPSPLPGSSTEKPNPRSWRAVALKERPRSSATAGVIPASMTLALKASRSAKREAPPESRYGSRLSSVTLLHVTWSEPPSSSIEKRTAAGKSSGLVFTGTEINQLLANYMDAGSHAEVGGSRMASHPVYRQPAPDSERLKTNRVHGA